MTTVPRLLTLPVAERLIGRRGRVRDLIEAGVVSAWRACQSVVVDRASLERAFGKTFTFEQFLRAFNGPATR